MKALTLWQPWASLLVYGEKKVETRSWTTKHRGRVAIHSAAKQTKIYGESRFVIEFKFNLALIEKRYNWGPGFWPNHENGFGAILGTGTLVGIERTEKVREDLSRQEIIFGNYEDGRYAWFFEDLEPFDKPIPTRGNRMLWNWNQLG